MFPSKTAMNYLWHETNIIPEEEIAQGSHYRARQAMLDNVRPTNLHYKNTVHIRDSDSFLSIRVSAARTGSLMVWIDYDLKEISAPFRQAFGADSALNRIRILKILIQR